ncbi:CubicO group peptidase, beta-lactamase class C family [Chitinophaga sp. CF118]|uniref:serine hydrolase domain-containing protein n=1 Tax=Chitinophaga sp. CF118 TaxID=1884367 RepID=UPI0008DEC6C4|nr:serine hydrolase domain-containing protein [Chitinophaga sp. CF118]SFE93900.1 CubicO group peptidase, beta-lactamase class C family [Chitinophaga sp. CF118]
MKAALIVLTISGIALSSMSACQSNAANNEKKRRQKDTINKSVPDEVAAAILNAPHTKAQQQELSVLYQDQLLRAGFNGAIVVAKKGVIIFEQYHGLENYRTKSPITDSSSFQMASVSKTFTGMGILWLAERQKLSLDDTIQQYFPEFPYMGITLRMLLSHRSGLPNYLYFCDSIWPNKDKFLTNEDVIKLMVQHKPPVQHQPNTHFQYCNTNFMLLGAIIEKVSKQKYGTFMQQTFFEPLGMNNTFVYDPSTATRPHQTVSHRYNGQAEPDTYFDGVIGDKGIYSTAKDMLKWDQALYGNKLFKPETLKEAYTPYSNEKAGVRNYGLGWRLLVYPDSSEIVYHNGWWHGNNTVFYRIVKDTSTIIILGNKYNRNIYHAVKPISAILGHGNGEEEGEE